jgi:anti-sigma B factor antagonist
MILMKGVGEVVTSNILETSIEQVAGFPVVRAMGEIDAYSAPEFKAAITEAVDSGAKNVVIDLESVSYIDSSGFDALLTAVKHLKPKGGSIRLVGCSEAVVRMLTITHLDADFLTFPTVAEAVG